MAVEVKIILPQGELPARFDDSPTGATLAAALPLEAEVSRWGNEVYFTVPVRLPEAPEARQDMAVGELGYWPVGAAFCIFFGPTPVSAGPTPRAYSNVNPFGQITADEELIKDVLARVKDGDRVRVTRA